MSEIRLNLRKVAAEAACLAENKANVAVKPEFNCKNDAGQIGNMVLLVAATTKDEYNYRTFDNCTGNSEYQYCPTF